MYADSVDEDEGLFAFAPPSLAAAPSPADVVDPSPLSTAASTSPARPESGPRPHTGVLWRPYTSIEDSFQPPSSSPAPGPSPLRAHTAPAPSDDAIAGVDLTPASAYATWVGYSGGSEGNESRRRSGLGEPTTPTSGGETPVDFEQARWRGKESYGAEDYSEGSGYGYSSAQEQQYRGAGGLGRSMRTAEVGIEMGGLGGDSMTTKGSDGEGAQVYLTDEELMAQYMGQEEEDSPYPEVRASVSNWDDTEMPVLTFRACLLGLSFSVLVGCANVFMQFRYPSPLMTPTVVLVAAYPAGKLLAWILPIKTYRLPAWLARFQFGEENNFSFNPGPFNIKEHTVILLMANVAISPVYALHLSVTLEKFYDFELGPGFDILLAVTGQTIGFAVAGLCRRFLVWPASLLWPQNLALSTLLNTLHAEDDDVEGGGITRYQFFSWSFGAAFAWYFLPGFLFQALSAFSWVCWIAPNNVVVNQLFGVSSGLGMGLLTFDWSQIAFIVSPLVVPWWAIVNVFVGFVALYWVISPSIYYSNVWNTAYLPLSSNSVFDRFGTTYNVSRVLSVATNSLNETAYENYSPLYLPSVYSMYIFAAFALATAAIVHTALYHGADIIKSARRMKVEEEDVHMRLMKKYPEVPDWWYLVFLLLAVGMSLAVALGFTTTLPWWGLLLSVAFGSLYVLPGGFIYALTATQIQINIPAQLVAGFAFPGQPIAVMLFKVYSICSTLVGLSFVQDLKLGHYMKIPPRVTFTVQIVATIASALAQVGVKRLISANVVDFCSPNQPARLNCSSTRVFYSASIIWGAVGPSRLFGMGKTYNPLLWGLLFGIVGPVLTWLLARRWPKSWVRLVNLPVALNGAMSMPPATGINYASWFCFGFFFQFLLRRRSFRLWSRFGYLLSAALDSGTVTSAVVIFLCLNLPHGGGVSVDWWGNNVYTKTLDYAGAAYKAMPASGAFA